MRFFIGDHYFISVIEKENGKLSCQVMKLVNGIGMINTKITSNQRDVVSCMVHTSKVFSELSKVCKNLEELSEFHTQLTREYHFAEIEKNFQLAGY